MEEFWKSLPRILSGTESDQLEASLALLRAAHDVVEGISQNSVISGKSHATHQGDASAGSRSTGHTATTSIATSAQESEEGGRLGGMTKDDTLGDLVGTLHQLNQFFTEEEESLDTHDTPVRHGRMRTIRPSSVSRLCKRVHTLG